MVGNNELKLEKVEFLNISIIVRAKRTFFIMDRVVISQLFLLILTGLITSLIVIIGISELLFPYWFIFIFLVPIVVIIITFKIKIKLHYFHHWTIVLIPVSIAWFSITVFFGVFIDFNLGLWKTLLVSIFLSLYYSIGYLIARFYRKLWQRFSNRSIQISTLIFSLTIIIITLLIGANILVDAMKRNNIKGFFKEDYGEFASCLLCATGVFIMLSGIGIVVSMLMNYACLSVLYNLDGKSKRDVLTEIPHKLILLYLTGTAIFILFFWIFMELLIPPIGGGGGDGGGGGGGGDGGSGGDGSKKYKKSFRTPLVDSEWKKYHLDVNPKL